MSRDAAELAPEPAGFDARRRLTALEVALDRHAEALGAILRLLESGAARRAPAEKRITVAAAAELLGISGDSVRRLIAAGRLPAWRIPLTGGQRATVVVLEADCLALLEPATPAPTAPRKLGSSG